MERICIFIIIIVSSLVSSCKNTVTKSELPDMYQGCVIEVYTIDSCEYITIANDTRSLTHKGNCKFCAKRNKNVHTGQIVYTEDEEKQKGFMLNDNNDTINVFRHENTQGESLKIDYIGTSINGNPSINEIINKYNRKK